VPDFTKPPERLSLVEDGDRVALDRYALAQAAYQLDTLRRILAGLLDDLDDFANTLADVTDRLKGVDADTSRRRHPTRAGLFDHHHDGA
jgi:hypothetical protein